MSTRITGAVAGLLACVAAGLEAQSPLADTLSLADAVAIAREANPMLQAARLRAEAAGYRISQAGALPDPQLAFGFMNRPVDDFGTDQPMTMNSMQLMQRFPWPGKLGFAEDRAEHLALAEQLDAGETEAALIARVKAVYSELGYVDRTLVVMEETRGLLRDFLQVSSAMYTVGSGLQQDVLQAQVAVANMTEDITVQEENRVALVARLNALLGRAPTVPVLAVELPVPSGALPSLDSLMAVAVETRPALRAARERVQAAQAGYRAARRALYPDLTFTLGYGQRPQFDDLATIMVGVSVPLFAGSRQLALRREMEAMQAMEEARERDLYNETFARLAELRADARRSYRLAELYATGILPQARAAVESALSAYRVGQVDYMTLVQNEMTVNRYEIEGVRLAATYHRAVAQMEALVGARLEGER